MSDSANAGMAAMQTPTRTEAEALAERWKVGHVYLSKNGQKVRIYSTTLKNKFPIMGVMLADADHADDIPETWRPDGTYYNGPSGLDLTLMEATT